MQEKTSADRPWELHISGKRDLGKGSAVCFPVGHRVWVAQELAGPRGNGAKKAAVQCSDQHLWRKGGGCGPHDHAGQHRGWGVGRQAASQAVQCQQRAWLCSWIKRVLYNQHLNTDQALLYFHSNYRCFGSQPIKDSDVLFYVKRPLLLPYSACALQVNDACGCCAPLALGH